MVYENNVCCEGYELEFVDVRGEGIHKKPHMSDAVKGTYLVQCRYCKRAYYVPAGLLQTALKERYNIGVSTPNNKVREIS